MSQGVHCSIAARQYANPAENTASNKSISIGINQCDRMLGSAGLGWARLDWAKLGRAGQPNHENEGTKIFFGGYRGTHSKVA